MILSLCMMYKKMVTGIKQPKDILHVVDETDKEFLVEAQYFNAPEPVRTEVIKST